MEDYDVDQYDAFTFRNFSGELGTIVEREDLFGWGLRIIQVNVRSIRDMERFDDVVLKLAVGDFRFDVIVLTESWIQGEVSQLYRIPGYVGVFACRPEGRGGGIAVFVREGIEFSVVRCVSDELDNVRLSLELGGQELMLDAYYRPPRLAFGTFLDVFEAQLRQCRDGSAVFVGDMNVDLFSNDSETRRYLDLLRSYSFAVTNDVVTRPASQSILDHVGAKLLQKVVNVTTDLDIRSDHLPVVTFLDSRVVDLATTTRMRRSTNVGSGLADLESRLMHYPYESGVNFCPEP